MSKWIKFKEQYILNTDKIKYCYIDDKTKNITIVFFDDEELTVKPKENLETVKDWKTLLESLDIDPPCWVYEELNGFCREGL